MIAPLLAQRDALGFELSPTAKAMVRDCNATAVAACPRAHPDSRARGSGHYSAHHDCNLQVLPGDIYVFHDDTKSTGSHP